MKRAIETLVKIRLTAYGLAWLTAWTAVAVPLLVGLSIR